MLFRTSCCAQNKMQTVLQPLSNRKVWFWIGFIKIGLPFMVRNLSFGNHIGGLCDVIWIVSLTTNPARSGRSGNTPNSTSIFRSKIVSNLLRNIQIIYNLNQPICFTSSWVAHTILQHFQFRKKYLWNKCAPWYKSYKESLTFCCKKESGH